MYATRSRPLGTSELGSAIEIDGAPCRHLIDCAMPTREEDLLKVVNGSGFLLQLAVEYAVTSQELGYPPWEVVVREHPWLDGDRSRFVDLVIGRPSLRLVIECKRPS